MNRYLSALVLGAALLASAPAKADEPRRYYDRDHKDYHEWNEGEERAYRRYLEERHRAYHEWSKANRREQREYWRWRHEHRD